MSNFNLVTLSKLIGELIDVSVANANTPFKAKVIEVKEAPLNGKRWESFIVYVTLHKKPEMELEQGLFDVNHEKFGDIQLFASPKSATELEFVVCRDRNPS